MERRILNPGELEAAVAGLDGWSVKGKTLTKEMKFDNFAEALAFVNRVGDLAEEADHHPDITFGWGYAEISLTTHDRGGVTDVDVAVAGRIDALDGQ
jgi:4a-hydroxytetrahydrobiopterin dehydratase